MRTMFARASDILALIKPRQTLLLLAGMYVGYIVAGGRSLQDMVIMGILGATSIASTTAMNMFFDRDIDSVMERTKNRPLASGRISPLAVFVSSLTLLVLSIALAVVVINPLYAAAIALGFFFDIVAYTILLKRRTPVSIVAGALAGGMPVIGGWAAATGTVSGGALLLALLVVSWVPAHIWFIASYYREDYERANIPMLPVVSNEAAVATCIALSSVVHGFSIAVLYLEGYIGLLALAVGLAVSVRIFLLSIMYSYGAPRGVIARFVREASILLALTMFTIIVEALLPELLKV